MKTESAVTRGLAFVLFVALGCVAACAAFDTYVTPTTQQAKDFPCGVVDDNLCAPVDGKESCCVVGSRCSFLQGDPICEADVAPTPEFGARKRYTKRVSR